MVKKYFYFVHNLWQWHSSTSALRKYFEKALFCIFLIISFLTKITISFISYKLSFQNEKNCSMWLRRMVWNSFLGPKNSSRFLTYWWVTNNYLRSPLARTCVQIKQYYCSVEHQEFWSFYWMLGIRSDLYQDEMEMRPQYQKMPFKSVDEQLRTVLLRFSCVVARLRAWLSKNVNVQTKKYMNKRVDLAIWLKALSKMIATSWLEPNSTKPECSGCA